MLADALDASFDPTLACVYRNSTQASEHSTSIPEDPGTAYRGEDTFLIFFVFIQVIFSQAWEFQNRRGILAGCQKHFKIATTPQTTTQL